MRPIDADALALETKRWFVIPDNRKTMKDAIDHAETLDYVPRQQWISVKDGAPPERIDKPGSERCFVYGVTPEGKKVIAISRYYSGEWVLFGELESENVTHWMPNPNPQPPKEG